MRPSLRDTIRRCQAERFQLMNMLLVLTLRAPEPLVITAAEYAAVKDLMLVTTNNEANDTITLTATSPGGGSMVPQ